MKKLPLPGFGLFVAMAVLVASAPQAEAKCLRFQETGAWTNIDPDSRIITGLKIGYVCKDFGRDGEFAAKGPRWYVEPVSECGAAECSWGRIGAERALEHYKPYPFTAQYKRDMSIRVKPIFAAFDREGLQFYLYIHMSPEEEGLLHVRLYTHGQDADGTITTEDLKFRKPDSPPPKGVQATLERE